MATAHLLISPHGQGLGRDLVIPIPARDVVSTTLRVGGAPSELPTLLTVERVIGRLSDVGLALRDVEQAKKIAGLVNKRFLPVPAEAWIDAKLRLDVESAGTPDALEALQAVAALRPPALQAADSALSAGPDYAFGIRRANENRLVTGLESAVEAKRGIWMQRARAVFHYLGTTVMGVLVEHLIGVPLVDIIRTTLGGALRTVT
jgi:hypothetical protein